MSQRRKGLRMEKQMEVSENRLGGLSERIAGKANVSRSELLMFNDLTAATVALLNGQVTSRERVLVVGHATPNLQIAIDQAELKMEELVGESVFNGSPDAALDKVLSGDEIIYVANPNRVSGTSLSLRDLERLATTVPRGLLLVDEHYHGFSGITGMSLTKEHESVVILRSLTAGFSIGSEAGYVIGDRKRLERLGTNQVWQKMSRDMRRIVSTTLANETVRCERLELIRRESRRLSTELTRAGIQNRLSPTDFLLLRVANPAQVCNHMAASKLSIENIDGYAGLRGFLKYTVQSEIINDRFLRAIRMMPKEYYHLEEAARFAQKLHRPSENTDRQRLEPTADRDSLTKKKLASRVRMSLIGSKQGTARRRK